jgi:hypothetical protein
MPSNEERMMILRMIEEEKITAEDGARLLAALGPGSGPGPGTGPGRSAAAAPSGGPRWLRVRVTDTVTGRQRVAVNVPASLVDAVLRLAERFGASVQGADAESVLAAIRAGASGKLVDVLDEEGGEHVEVFLE